MRLADQTGRPRMRSGKMATDYDRFFTLSLDMLCVAGFDGYFKELNPAWERTLGYTTAELMAKPFLEFVHPDDRKATTDEAAKLSTGVKTIYFENRYLGKDGSYKWLAWTCAPAVETEMLYAVAHDITAQKQAEQRLLEELEHNRSILEAANDAFISMDADMVLTGWNAQAEATFGWTREEAIGRSVATIMLPPERQAAYDAGLRDFFASGAPDVKTRQESTVLHR